MPWKKDSGAGRADAPPNFISEKTPTSTGLEGQPLASFGQLPEKSHQMAFYIFTWEQRGWGRASQEPAFLTGAGPPCPCPVGLRD